ncbi:MAG TPA: stage V sporulation protein T [Lachnospiraceae bacterium]|nr:stage V sporulation protein T [Lachnospiraceae bacterium]
MKATGIVRRIDDLGRVVVPKEIRRTLRIREGDPLEIFTDREGEIILKKYSPIGEMNLFAKQYAESLAQVTGYVVCITDRDQIIAVGGGGKSLLNKSISAPLEEAIDNREVIFAKKGDKKFLQLSDEVEDEAANQVVVPIISEGDAIGAVVIYSKDDADKMSETEQKVAQSAASFLGRQMEQ